MVEAILGVLYVATFAVALFLVYVGAYTFHGREKVGQYRVIEHGLCVFAALYWPLTIMVVLGWLGIKGLMKGAAATAEKVEERSEDWKEGWRTR